MIHLQKVGVNGLGIGAFFPMKHGFRQPARRRRSKKALLLSSKLPKRGGTLYKYSTIRQSQKGTRTSSALHMLMRSFRSRSVCINQSIFSRVSRRTRFCSGVSSSRQSVSANVFCQRRRTNSAASNCFAYSGVRKDARQAVDCAQGKPFSARTAGSRNQG